MGSVASLMTGKVSVTQGKSFLYRKLYNQFILDKPINDFDDFHMAFLQIINTINSVVPGRHYDVPGYGEIEGLFNKRNCKKGSKILTIPENAPELFLEFSKYWTLYNKWKDPAEKDKENLFLEFIRDRVNMRSVDRSMILTGLAAPPAAMVAKRAGESLPQLKIIKVVPDLLFVPSSTLLALVGCKLATTLSRVS